MQWYILSILVEGSRRVRKFVPIIAALIVAHSVNFAVAQEFDFGTDLIDGVESGRAGGGFATGYMDFAIDGNQLTAVLRNTSPEVENFGGDPAIGSPVIRRTDFDLRDVVGEALQLLSWELTAFDAAHEAVVLGSDLNGGVDEWRMTQREDGSFRVKSRGSGTPTAPIYNPNASGGFATSAIYYSDAVLTATFNATIGATDLKPELRFKYLGENGIATTLTGIALPVVATQPEPSSVLVWGGLIAACGWRWRRKNHRRR